MLPRPEGLSRAGEKLLGEFARREMLQLSQNQTLSDLAAGEQLQFFTIALARLTGELDFDLFAQASFELGLELEPRLFCSQAPFFAGLVMPSGELWWNHTLFALPVAHFEPFRDWFGVMGVYDRANKYYRRFGWTSVSVPDVRPASFIQVACAAVYSTRGEFVLRNVVDSVCAQVRFDSFVAPALREFQESLETDNPRPYGSTPAVQGVFDASSGDTDGS